MDKLTNISNLTMAVSMLAFFVSAVTELTKEISFLKKIPTVLQVLVLSLILCPLSLAVYAAYYEIALTWYLIVASVCMAFIVAFIAMYGWEKFVELWSRFRRS